MKRFILIAGGAIIIPTMPAIAGGPGSGPNVPTSTTLLGAKIGAGLKASGTLNATLGSTKSAKSVAHSGGKLLNVTLG